MRCILLPSVLALFLSLSACGGSVSGGEGTTAPAGSDPSRSSTSSPSGESTTPPRERAPLPAEACRAQPVPVTGTASCDVARNAFVVEVSGVRWRSPTDAWKAGATGFLDMRFRNEASNSAIHYPGVSIASPDARVDTDAETHDDGAVHPDLYMIAQCTTEPVTHPFTVKEALPSGAKIQFVLTPVVATGNDISSCGGTLAKVTFEATVP